MYNFRVSWALLCIAFFYSHNAMAGAWTMEAGTQKHFVTYRYYGTDAFFDVNGNKRDKQGTFRKHELEYYTEYGWTPKLTIGTSITASQEEDKQDFTSFDPVTGEGTTTQRVLNIEGLSRIEPFLRYQLYRDDLYAVAIQPSVKLPSLYANNLPAEAQPDEWEAELAVLVGRNFTLWDANHYAETKLAYRDRFGELGNQYIIEARAGFQVHPKWTLIPELQLTRATGKIRTNFATLSGSNDFDLSKGQISALYALTDNTHLQLGAFQHISGKNTGAGGGALASLWLSF